MDTQQPSTSKTPAMAKQEVDSEAGQVIAVGKHDKALNLLAENHIDFDPDSAEAKRLLRKIDWRIMPMVFTVYLLQLMDKNSLSFAAIMGVREDTNLTASQYSWLGSIVYFGYLGGEIPATFLMQRFPLARYLAVMCTIWGLVVAMHGVCHNFAGLAAVRFLLGFIEVCTAPAVIMITASWYTKTEQVTRVAIWYTTSGWAQVFGGFFSWCIYQAGSFRWQGLFVLYGGLTFLTGVKVMALERVRSNKTGTEVWKFNASQLKEAFMDPRFYGVFLLLVCTGLPNGGVTAFGPTIIRAFGFSVSQTTLLNMGVGGAQVVGTVLALFIAKKTNRTIAGIWTLILAIIGTVMMLAIPARYNEARYGGYILLLQFPICVLFIITFMTGGVAGSTKKFAFGAAYQLGYAVGNLIGPQTFRGSDAPDYPIAKYTMLAFLVLTAILLSSYGGLHYIWNKRRDARARVEGEETHMENEEFADLTDFNIKSFRYPL
ncbi:putative transporter [Cyphellophora attinorum]|uniref:Putative transporter n=1 Tax=Cyphellophora attinorum TaxID=1664694 RepID=A0A0N1HEC3_9EURO|nr:putative transporter [Phialophora attinorum]KPI43104.1 putative transporter [Phialophora attinorum]